MMPGEQQNLQIIMQQKPQECLYKLKPASKNLFRDRIICVSFGKSMNLNLQFNSKIGDTFHEK